MSTENSRTEAPPIERGSTRASWNFSLDNIRQDTAAFGEEAQETLIAVFRWCIDPRHPVAKPDLATRLGCSDNLLYQIYTGRYRNPDTKEQKGPSAKLLQAMREFLKLEEERFIGGDTQFVMTPTAQKVFTTCDLVRESHTVALMWGPSHIGKTWAGERYAADNNHGRTVYVRLMAASGLGGMVRRIATRLGISQKSNTASLTERIKNALTGDMVLFIDECHLLAHTYRKGSFHNCMEVLREIHDETRCGMVLCFTILDDVRAASQKELQQLWRRGVHKVPLPMMPTKADLAVLLKHNGLQFPEEKLEVTVGKMTEKPYEVLRQIAKRDGLLAITERLRYARKLASKSGAALQWEHVMDAHLRIEKQAVQVGEWN